MFRPVLLYTLQLAVLLYLGEDQKLENILLPIKVEWVEWKILFELTAVHVALSRGRVLARGRALH